MAAVAAAAAAAAAGAAARAERFGDMAREQGGGEVQAWRGDCDWITRDEKSKAQLWAAPTRVFSSSAVEAPKPSGSLSVREMLRRVIGSERASQPVCVCACVRALLRTTIPCPRPPASPPSTGCASRCLAGGGDGGCPSQSPARARKPREPLAHAWLQAGLGPETHPSPGLAQQPWTGLCCAPGRPLPRRPRLLHSTTCSRLAAAALGALAAACFGCSMYYVGLHAMAAQGREAQAEQDRAGQARASRAGAGLRSHGSVVRLGAQPKANITLACPGCALASPPLPVATRPRHLPPAPQQQKPSGSGDS